MGCLATSGESTRYTKFIPILFMWWSVMVDATFISVDTEKMKCKQWLEVGANFATITTFFGGLGAWSYYQWGFWSKRKALEEYLKEKLESYKRHGSGDYQFSVLHLTAKVGLTESEILQACFKNPRIERLEKLGYGNITTHVMFQYNDASN